MTTATLSAPPPAPPPAPGFDPSVFAPAPLPALPLAGGLTAAHLLIAALAVCVPAMTAGAALLVWAAARAAEPRQLRNIAALAVAAGAVVSLIAALGWGVPPWAGLTVAVRTAWTGLDTGDLSAWAAAAALSAVSTAPLAAIAAWWWWHNYTRTMRSGRAHAAGERHARRQWDTRRAAAATRARRDPTPLTSDDGEGPAVVLGPRIESVSPYPPLLRETFTRRKRPWLTVPLAAIALHLAVIAQTGAGKTVLLIRLAAAWWQAAWHAHTGTPADAVEAGRRSRSTTRPLVIFLDAKGEPDTTTSAGTGGRWTTALTALGVDRSRIGMFPTETTLNMWRLPAPQLKASLHKLAATDHRFYDVLQRGLLHLVIDQPDTDPPTSSRDFLARLTPARLTAAWAGQTVEERMIAALTGDPTTSSSNGGTSANGGNTSNSSSSGSNGGGGGKSGGATALDADLMLFAELFRSLGDDFDGGRPLSAFDALYASVPGTLDPVVAAAKAAVLIELLTFELVTEPRTVLFVIDEFSAISGDTAGTVINLVERLRSLGGAVVVSAQSYQGLAESDDDRERLLGAMGGGMLIGRTQNADPLAARFGTRHVDETGLQIAGGGEPGQGGPGLLSGGYTGAGTVRRQHTFLLDPNRIRTLPPHHVAYATPDEIVYGRVTPLHTTTGAQEDEQPS